SACLPLGEIMAIQSPASRHAVTVNVAAIVSLFASMVLALAVITKLDHVSVLDRLGSGLWYKPDLAIPLIAFEAALALWLLVGIWPQWGRWIPAACFAVFSMAALYQAMSGATSCGCFGKVKVNPWITFGMDVLLAAGLWV